MPYQRFHARAESPTLDLVVDMGNPILNSTVNGFLKVGPVGATHAATQEAFRMFTKESVTKRDLEGLVKKAGKEGLQWGLVAGVYSGVEYGIHRVRGKRDWKNAALGGALTGAILTMGDKHFDKQKLIQTAITGGAFATANELLRYL
ncbi:hypothetical protein M758_6G001600 [Ceratodon purpureus]|uniref:Uncharacterized protein n=1 Tax=Ceratodon purpureus TaxID=3225 RepID=A0A8T0HGN0_CERPU|nr:hypothetical protein KC19_6G001300 [Ceratodon purpureus]KAG0612101.1 hypothetical protein M758_6G001600 [Ceratodon purpureus]